MPSKNIYVSKPFIPQLEDYNKYLSIIFENEWLTNNGVLHQELTKRLKSHFNVNHLTLTNNGTLPLHMALRTLPEKGEIITTPFSYVATTSAIAWEQFTPVFVDIEPHTYTIDPNKLEDAITPKTKAILATHVYGNPCDVEAIETIAKKHNLRVFYDAAQAFGVKYKGKDIMQYGEISTCSFHATKLFHTAEGGCASTNNEEIHQLLDSFHNFGFNTEKKIQTIGTNAKMSELNAAMGLSVLDKLPEITEYRKKITHLYNELLQDADLKLFTPRVGTEWNYIGYVVFFPSEKDLLLAQKRLNKQNIFPRRYFYPTLNQLPYVTYSEMPIAEHISKRALALPVYSSLLLESVETIAKLIKN